MQRWHMDQLREETGELQIAFIKTRMRLTALAERTAEGGGGV
jgi:hypothetical protein